MSAKDYMRWHILKTAINEQFDLPYFYTQEVWWATLGHNIGNEQDGKGAAFARPVLILQKFNRSFFLCIPLSSTQKTGKYYHHFTYSGHSSTAILSQIRALDARRLIRKHGWIDQTEFDLLRTKIKALI